jgi:peptidase M23B
MYFKIKNGNQLSEEEKKVQYEATQLVWKADKKYAEGFRLASVFMDEENEKRIKEEEEKKKKISNNGKISRRKKGSRR